MTEFKDVQVGDRVRLTHENGDLAEFTAIEREYDRHLESEANTFSEDDGWQIEILEKPLPRLHNAMIGHPTDNRRVPMVLLSDGWTFVGTGAVMTLPQVRQFMSNDGYVVLYEGVES